ncbi:PREDICTED: probable receptor-like protein kinase At5g47070 isoform X4 [Nelumbo nucifera]|uniref:non-specific serine/threonine protein kinase n=1 Tax=Nelumbo nucifera TaxID=4432 RepID=A0A1U8ATT9_NELNU|nr:PREDICTED: probable receptor-like protein kinase At5g47070 isoform X4 [Nelumbo nucifera]
MKCLFYFKDKSKSRQQNSAPELKNRSPPDNSPRAVKSSGSEASQRSIPELYEEKAHNLRVFSFSELRNATNDFNRMLKIGEGGFGSVYKGFIKPPNGQGEKTVVAVKKLNRDGLQGHKQWVAEVQFLGVVDHPNLVKLIGYCAVDGERGIQRLLVYEFMPNKSLEDHLFSKAFPSLPWKRRLEIVLGAAEGLAYLHEGLEIQVVGTYGYAAPDYVETGHLTTKSDVWSFGVVLYEILTGRRSLERNRPRMEQKLLEWVRQFPVDSRKFCMIMDPRLQNQYSLNAARRIAKLADSCLCKNPKDRPKMSRVVESLKEAIQVCEEGSPSEKRTPDYPGTNSVDSDKNPDQIGTTESARRRMAHLASLSENVNVVGRRRFMNMQRTKVP